MRIPILVLSTLLALPLSAQHRNSYAAAYRGHMDVAVVPEKEVVLSVDVYSRWNLRNGAGLAQFRIYAIPTIKAASITEEVRATVRAHYIVEMTGCHLALQLTDGEEFPLGVVPLNITNEVDSEGRQSSLAGTGSLKLTETEYLGFVRKGAWNLTWACP